MYTKLLIVTFLQVALARRLIPSNPEDQRTLRHPANATPAVQKDTEYKSEVVSVYNSHLDKNYDLSDDYQHNSKIRDGKFYTRRAEQTHRRRERSEEKNLTDNEYRSQNVKNNRNGEAELGASNHANVAEATRITARSPQHSSTSSNQQNTLKINLGSQQGVRRASTPDGSLKYNMQVTDSSQRQGIENEVASNETSTNANVHNSKFSTQPYEEESKSAYSKMSRQGQTDIGNNNISKAAIDKHEYTDSRETSTGDDGADNNNENRNKKTDDKWVWDKSSTTNIPNVTKMSDFNIDDRVLFDVDSCPDGKVKVKDVCLDKH